MVCYSILELFYGSHAVLFQPTYLTQCSSCLGPRCCSVMPKTVVTVSRIQHEYSTLFKYIPSYKTRPRIERSLKEQRAYLWESMSYGGAYAFLKCALNISCPTKFHLQASEPSLGWCYDLFFFAFFSASAFSLAASAFASSWALSLSPSRFLAIYLRRLIRSDIQRAREYLNSVELLSPMSQR
jgi:hypothetical protein